MKIFVCGGAKSGKSAFAQKLALTLAAGGTHYYVATLIPYDEEDRQRIRRHLADREGLGFLTLEQGRALPACLDRADCSGTFLLDSVTALWMNELFPDPHSAATDPGATERCVRDLEAFLGRVRNAVLVSDDLFCDPGDYDAVTECYRRGLGELHRAIARSCDVVLEAPAGQMTVYKGRLPL